MIVEWVKVWKPARPLRSALNSAVKRVLQVYCIEIQNFVQSVLFHCRNHKTLQWMIFYISVNKSHFGTRQTFLASYDN